MTREEALKILRGTHDKALFSVRNALETLIPELAESEDERMVKAILSAIRGGLDTEKFLEKHGTNYEEVEAYLEKHKHCWKPTETDAVLFNIAVTTNETLTSTQRAQLDVVRSKFGCCSAVDCSGIEQKPAEWKPQSESLEALRYAIEGKWEMIKPTSYLSRRLEDLYEELVNNFNVDETLVVDKDIEELEAMKAEADASMEKPVEWSEEDEEKMNSISEIIEHCVIIPYSGGKLTVSKEYKKELQCFLKSLRPSWKPNKEQIYSLGTVVKGMGYVSEGSAGYHLKELYEQLKKLM